MSDTEVSLEILGETSVSDTLFTLLAGKSKMSALGAAMRKLAHLCFAALKTRSPYRPDYC